MDSIGSLNPVLDALRRQLAQNVEQLRKHGKLPALSEQRAEAAALQSEGIETILRRKLAAADLRTAEGRARATRAFVGTVLVAEFGDALLADPGVGQLLEQISASLREDPGLRKQLDDLLRDLS